MKLCKINYNELKPKQQEIHNFQKVASALADYGFNCIKLADDWHGADFLAYHKDGNDTLKVQLKGRITIDKKYLGKELYMSFPISGRWYLIEHDVLVQLVSENTNWLNTESWLSSGSYSSGKVSQSLQEKLIDHVL
jgi:hypothetical protein